MCGLFGWQWEKGKTPNKHKRQALAHSLAEGNDERGGQSWGAWSPDLLLRGIGPAHPHSFRLAGLESMFGHSRWATHGANTTDNTHPFVKSGVALSHNGVISNHSALNRENNRTCVVDSEHLLLHMLDSKPFKDIKGYGAITWTFPAAEDSIYMGRLSETGVLTVLLTEFGVLWSSEEETALKACKTAGVRVVHPYIIKPGQAYFAKDGKLWVDKDLPSIMVSPPEVYRSTHSYTTSPREASGAWTVYWCNKHKDIYSHCPCKGGAWHADNKDHVVELPDNAVTPKKGETYTPPAAVSSKSTPQGSGDTPWHPYCETYLCLAKQEAGSKCCREHAKAVDGGAVTTEKPASVVDWIACAEKGCITKLWAREGTMCYIHRLSAKGSVRLSGPDMCKTHGCYAPQVVDSLWCSMHSAGMQAKPPVPQPPSTTTQPKTPAVALVVSNDMKTEYKAGDRGSQFKLLCDLAEWWMESEHGMVQDVTNGLTGLEVLELAESFGFDTNEALRELEIDLDPEQEQANDNPTPAEPSVAKGSAEPAGVAVPAPTPEHQPTDGGESEAVVVS